MIPENQLDLFIGLLSTEQSTLSSKLGDSSNNDAKAVLSERKDINAVLTLLYRLSEKLKKSPRDSTAPAKEATKKKKSK